MEGMAATVLKSGESISRARPTGNSCPEARRAPPTEYWSVTRRPTHRELLETKVLEILGECHAWGPTWPDPEKAAPV